MSNSQATLDNPYKVVISRHVTEKSVTLEGLKDSKSNKCSARCQTPKYVFLVHPKATKPQIKAAVEKIYADKNIKVRGVNTSSIKRKPKRMRGRKGYTSVGKKAVVTLEPGDAIDNL